jgi:hypothetical protein
MVTTCKRLKEEALQAYEEKLRAEGKENEEISHDGNARFLERVLAAIKLEIDVCLMFGGMEPERGNRSRVQSTGLRLPRMLAKIFCQTNNEV